VTERIRMAVLDGDSADHVVDSDRCPLRDPAGSRMIGVVSRVRADPAADGY
jgi:hypothetical protein